MSDKSLAIKAVTKFLVDHTHETDFGIVFDELSAKEAYMEIVSNIKELYYEEKHKLSEAVDLLISLNRVVDLALLEEDASFIDADVVNDVDKFIEGYMDEKQ